MWCKAIGKLCDKPPFFQDGYPTGRCSEKADYGKIEKVYDPRLGGYVKWICVANPAGGYRWHRLPGVTEQVFNSFWQNQPRKPIFDWHRKCKSIVCERIAVEHMYPTDIIFPGSRVL